MQIKLCDRDSAETNITYPTTEDYLHTENDRSS